MKISIDIDCTPIEARSFLGLPDMAPVHAEYVKSMSAAFEKAGSVEQMQSLMESFAPMGTAGMEMFRKMMELGTASVSGSTKG